MTDRYTQFLAGERHEDVALYLTEDVVENVASLADRDDAVAYDDGVVLVVDGEKGRGVFQQTTGMAAMEFAQEAMGADGHVERDLAGGECPDAGDGESHDVSFVFAFTEEQNEEVGGLYAEGPVVHAYAHCECGASYSERWLCEE